MDKMGTTTLTAADVEGFIYGYNISREQDTMNLQYAINIKSIDIYCKLKIVNFNSLLIIFFPLLVHSF